MIENKQQAKIAQKAQRGLYHAIFGTPYIAEYLAVFLVLTSVILAIFIPHEGWFPTSRSEGMTNYHRWLYDQFVIISCMMGLVLYYILQRQKQYVVVRQQWRSYIQAQAIFKIHRIQKAIQQGKKPLIQSRGAEIAVILFMLMIFILMYSVLVPNPSARRGQFFIQTWWPINAGFIGLLYYINFWLYLRLFAVNDVEKQYTLLQRRKSG